MFMSLQALHVELAASRHAAHNIADTSCDRPHQLSRYFYLTSYDHT